MQSVQHKTLTLPFESLTTAELVHYCELHLDTGGDLPVRAQKELVRRLAAANKQSYK